MKMNEILEGSKHGNSKVYDKCWTGFKKVPGKKRGEKGSCKETTTSAVASTNNGFANGGIGVMSRNLKKKSKKKNT
jgi:hypothetical protein